MSIASRVVVCAVVCAALGAPALLVGCPKDDVARPLERGAPPTHGLADARVLHVVGNVEITSPMGAVFVAKVGSDLVADDRIGAATSSMVVVALRNGHVVRIDDAGALKVRDIVLFQAPTTERPAEEQLQELLDDGENVPLADVRERAAAWRQMLRAAETAGAESSADRDEEKSAAPERAMAQNAKAKDGPSAQEPSAVATADAAPPAAQAPPVPTEAADLLGGVDGNAVGVGGLGLRGAGPAGGGGGGGGAGLGISNVRGGAGETGDESKMSRRSKKELDVDKGAKDAPTAGKLQGMPIDAEALQELQRQLPTAPLGFTARFGASAQEATPVALTPALAAMGSELGACIGRSLPASVTLSSAELLVEVRGDTAKRVRLNGALPVPLCARSVAVQNAAREIAAARGAGGAGGAGGWLVVTVPLTR